MSDNTAKQRAQRAQRRGGDSGFMGTDPMPGLILRTSIPLIFSLLANTLYNVVDSIFVARISEDALAAISLAAPMQLLAGALGNGIAVGLNAAISKALGERNTKEVRDTASAAMFIGMLAGLIIAVAGVLFATPYFNWQSGGNQAIAAYGVDYLSICMFFAMGQMGQWVFDRFLIATGKSKLFLLTLCVASIVNLILDPILIFGYLGFPAMGTKGAAIATVIGQFAGAILGVLVNTRYNKEIPIRFTLRVKARCVTSILKVGIPTAIMRGVMATIGIFINTLLIGFSSTVVAIYGICNRIQNMVLIGVNGINNGLIPIIAYNFGARQRDRIGQAIKWAMIYAFGIMAIMLLAQELFPAQILSLFSASDHMLQLGIPAIRLMAFSYVATTFCLIYSAAFQALGQGAYSMYLTIARQVVLLLPLVYLFSKLGNLTMVWVAFTLAEVLAIPVALFLYRKVSRNTLDYTVGM